MVSYNKQNSTSTTHPWVGRILLIVTDHIQVQVGLGLTPNQSLGWGSPDDCGWYALLCKKPTVISVYRFVIYHFVAVPFCNMCRFMTVYSFVIVPFCNAVRFCNEPFCNVPWCNVPLGNVPFGKVPLRNVPLCISTNVPAWRHTIMPTFYCIGPLE
jgi:hypothetical protein